MTFPGSNLEVEIVLPVSNCGAAVRAGWRCAWGLLCNTLRGLRCDAKSKKQEIKPQMCWHFIGPIAHELDSPQVIVAHREAIQGSLRQAASPRCAQITAARQAIRLALAVNP